MATKPISKNSWRVALTEALRRLRPNNPHFRVAVLGIGHELRGDDGAGLAVVRTLARSQKVRWRTKAANSRVGRFLVVDGGAAPENHTGMLSRFAPTLLIVIDAAMMQARLGRIRVVDWRLSDGPSASTHALPLRVLLDYLIARIGCQVLLIGIQPAGNAIDSPLTRPVRRAVHQLAQGLQHHISLYLRHHLPHRTADGGRRHSDPL